MNQVDNTTLEPDDIPHRGEIEPIAVDVDGAAALIGVSRSTFYKLMDEGKIGPMGVKFSAKCHRFPLAELRAWAAASMPSREQWQKMRAAEGFAGNIRMTNTR